MAHAFDLNHLGPRYGSAIGVDTSARDHHVARAPYQQRGRFQAAQEVRETRVMHERLPSDARGLGAGVLEGFETLRRHLTAVEFAELRRFDRIRDRGEKMLGSAAAISAAIKPPAEKPITSIGSSRNSRRTCE